MTSARRFSGSSTPPPRPTAASSQPIAGTSRTCPCELESEIAAGVTFWGYQADGALIGIMGIQPVRDVYLIRHVYVSPGSQRHGIGGALLEHLARSTTRRMLVGTWAAADWAIRFYRRHGFELVSPECKTALLKTYWTIPDRQIEASVVLANPQLEEA